MLCLGGHLLWGKGWAPVMVQSVVENESEQELEDQLDVELKQSQNQPALESLQSRASPFFKEETEEPNNCGYHIYHGTNPKNRIWELFFLSIFVCFSLFWFWCWCFWNLFVLFWW
jgi:hypothetical protein